MVNLVPYPNKDGEPVFVNQQELPDDKARQLGYANAAEEMRENARRVALEITETEQK